MSSETLLSLERKEDANFNLGGNELNSSYGNIQGRLTFLFSGALLSFFLGSTPIVCYKQKLFYSSEVGVYTW